MKPELDDMRVSHDHFYASFRISKQYVSSHT